MGILNVTPDSFSDGGAYPSAEAVARRGEEMVSEGADLLDVGGESTRPGAAPVSATEELARILPVIRLLAGRLSTPISVDTRKPEVARAAIDAGAEVVNDISALADPEMARVVAEAGAGVVLMHMRGTPETMQLHPGYDDVVREVTEELGEAMRRAAAVGIHEDRIVIDPGIGFAKTATHNLQLLSRLSELAILGRPLLLGVSRKAFIGSLLGGAAPAERAIGTAAACVTALMQGARIFRVHDVRTVREALTVAEAIRVAS